MLSCFSALPALADGDFAEELELTDFNLSQKPNDAALWYFRSTLSLRNHEPDRAIADAERAGQLAPGKFPIRAVIAQSLAETGSSDEAMEMLDAELRRFPDQPEARLVRARLQVAASAAEPALADYRIAIRNLTSATPIIYLEVADILLRNGYRKEAADLIGSAITKLGEDPQLVGKALELAVATKDFDGAFRFIAILEKSAARPEPMMAERARVLALAGRAMESRAAWTALRDRVAAMPNLERGGPGLTEYAAEAERNLTAPNF